MGLAYCSVDDLAQTAVKYRQNMAGFGSADTVTLTTEDLQQFIADASDMVRGFYRPRYTVEVIDAYAPTFPPLIVTATKLQAAILLYERAGAVNADADAPIIERLQMQLKRVKHQIGGGLVLDADSVEVVQDLGVELYQESATDRLEELLNEPRY